MILAVGKPKHHLSVLFSVLVAEGCLWREFPRVQRPFLFGLAHGDIMKRKVNVHFFPTRFPRALDCRLHVVAKSYLSQLQQQKLPIHNQETTSEVLGHRSDGPKAEHATREQDCQKRWVCDGLRRRNQLFVPTAQRRKFDFSKQFAIGIHVAAGKQEALPIFKSRQSSQSDNGCLDIPSPECIDRASHADELDP